MKTVKEYLKDECVCPHCDSGYVHHEEPRGWESDGELSIMSICLTCEKEWYEVYRIAELKAA